MPLLVNIGLLGLLPPPVQVTEVSTVIEQPEESVKPAPVPVITTLSNPGYTPEQVKLLPPPPLNIVVPEKPLNVPFWVKVLPMVRVAAL